MKRGLVIAVLVLLSLCILFSGEILGFFSGGLYLHMPPGSGVQVTHNQGVYGRVNSARRIPLEHGVYELEITFADGKEVYAKFLHVDAGAKYRMDIYVTRDAGSDVVHFRGVLNSSEEEFSKQVRLETTTPEKPFLLDWPI